MTMTISNWDAFKVALVPDSEGAENMNFGIGITRNRFYKSVAIVAITLVAIKAIAELSLLLIPCAILGTAYITYTATRLYDAVANYQKLMNKVLKSV